MGPWTGRGPITSNRGNITDLPSTPGDPDNSSWVEPINQAGSFVVLTTGRNFTPIRENPITCAFIGRVTDLKGKVVSGTGAYANLTGNFNVTVTANAIQPRNTTAPFACNFDADNSAFETDTATAVGLINLH